MSINSSVLILNEVLAPLAPSLSHDHRVLCAWERPEQDELDAVRAVVVAGDNPVGAAELGGLPALGLVACFTAGYEGIDLDWARSRRLRISHAPGVNHEDVADHALGLIIASLRGLLVGDRCVREGRWSPQRKIRSQSLAGQRVGIVGLGRIGQAIARRCDVLRMSVRWWGPRPKLGEQRPRAASLLELARNSDILVVACTATANNHEMINTDVLHALGTSGLLVNVARGQLVDEDALIAALKSGQLGGAALDVFTQEPTPPARWLAVPNVILTPHEAGATDASVARMLQLLRTNLDAFFAGRPLETPLL